MTYPNINQAGQAADLLGMDVFDLALALRCFAEDRFRADLSVVRDYQQPNFGRARRAMAAAIACDQAWAEESAARADVGATEEGAA